MSIPPYDELFDWLEQELRGQKERGARLAEKSLRWLQDNPPPSALYDHDHTLGEALTRIRNAVAEQIIAENRTEPDRAEGIYCLDQAVNKVQERVKKATQD
jgi:hypothetical protein